MIIAFCPNVILKNFELMGFNPILFNNFCMQNVLLQKMMDLYRYFIILSESRMGRIDDDIWSCSRQLGFMHKYRAVIGLQMRLKLGKLTVTGNTTLPSPTDEPRNTT